MLNPEEFPHAPTIIISAIGLLQATNFMIDTGAAPNVIKRRSLHPDAEIKHDNPLYLSGISSGKVETLGSIEISILGHSVSLYIVPDNFPIAQEGILGSDFLRDATNINLSERYIEWHQNKIPFASRETIVAPARSQTTFYLKIDNPQVDIGYVPRLDVCEGVYLGDAVVTNRRGKAYIRVINTNDIDRELIVPTIKLQEIEQISSRGPTDNVENRAVYSIQSQKANNQDEQIHNLLRLDHLNYEEMNHAKRLINKHRDLFQLPGEEPSHTNVIKHKINTTDDQPINTKQYRFPPIHKNEIDRQVGEMLKNGIIEPSVSPYNSPLWIVPKKADSKGNKRWRLVIDFRALNEKTLGDAYPLPNIIDILDQLGSAKYFSVFDLASGFHQIPMHESDAPKTAFSTPFGHYEFKRMPFGLKNAPATFQRLMDRVLSGLQGTSLFVYLDDIVIYASSLTEHEAKFNKLAERLRVANLRLQPDKCEFLRKEVAYLGHIISQEGVKPDPKKIEAVLNFPRPKNAKNIKQFLGLAGYYRRFLNDFSRIAKPLTVLLKKDEPFIWLEEQEKAFVTLRDNLCTEPLLQHPDFTEPFVLTTDASGYAVGGILSQGNIGKDKPIAYASRLLNKAEQNYSTIEKELLAIVYCVHHFRPYLYGNKFTLVTDHKPLVWLHNVKDPTSRLIRWRLKLAEYDYAVIYKAGKTNCNADALSRNPVENESMPQDRDFKKRHVAIMNAASDTDDEIFECRPRNQTIEDKQRGDKPDSVGNPKLNDPSNINLPPDSLIINSPSPVPDNHSETDILLPNSTDPNEPSSFNTPHMLPAEDETTCSDTNSECDSVTTISSDESLFETPNPPYERRPHIQFCYTKDNILTKYDNIVVFITQTGNPCDIGAETFVNTGRMPPIEDAMLARAKVLPYREHKKLIALTVKEHASEVIEREIIQEAMYSLLDVVKELKLDSFSICKGDVGNVSWDRINKMIENTLFNTKIVITVCTNDIIIPLETERQELISEYHASALGGHKGVAKTYQRIREKYYWPGMRAEIQNYISECRNCQLKKLVRKKVRQPMVLTDTPGAAFDKISMDIMGPLPVTRTGNSYILTIQDLLSKYSLAIPLGKSGAIDVAEAFANEFICVYGAPKALLTDQGSHFLNSLMKAIARKFKIKRYQTTAYRPQANGSIERSHHVLWEYLKQLVDDKGDWDKYLKLACFSYNTSVHEGTSFTPHELVFGKLARTPASEVQPEDLRNESYNDYLENLCDRLRYAQEAANKNLRNAKERSKQYYDKRARPYNFKQGQLVYLLKEPTHKLGNQYSGPYRILEMLRNNNVKLAISARTTRVVHTDKLKPSPHHQRSEDEELPRQQPEQLLSIASTTSQP